MGLDMFLFEVPKIGEMTCEEVLSVHVELGRLKSEKNELYEQVKPYVKNFVKYGHKWKSLLTEVAYWRKANQIHHWFVENVQEGVDPSDPYEVSREQLVGLHQLCIKVIDTKQAPALLPTQPGFFFGSTDYDDYYYLDVEYTKSITEILLNTFNFDTHYLVYQSSW
ncbi:MULTISPECIES: hypothetical protein [unclassified Bacillus (in: firmicutes)]|uniref:hypothetical protein n=1 Tax=unclassified Bacillus (in: firmicutes) TaxID=185979 RepID=UPI0008F0E29F|nr:MULTISPECIES: hypothetical protein [unclassified Bacillus (in: firmicutes)]SFA89590.1 hypothetical protein SAMN02799634_102411 [Bacillus sp. UNCCL13]SFQ84963.1 hypothetical protein SAMN04488577_2530 [Bacillus sp. cl95]